ncbi:MAG: cation diffusion facilitator family transporter [Pseudomonadota bacterium]
MAHEAASGPGPIGRLAPPDAARITQRTAGLAVAMAGVLIAIKAWAWFVSGSVAMLASLADSGLDLAASLFTLWAVTYAAAPPDPEHRYGHGKAESFAGLFQALLVGASATFVAIEAFDRFQNPQPIQQGGLAIAVMVISIGLTLALLVAQSRAVNATGSVATSGDRAHYAADLGANLAVILGVAASAFLGWPLADPLIGLGVALWLAWSALEVARGATNQLMDRELPADARERIVALAEAADPRVSVHQLRTRAAGPIIHIQFHLDLPPTMSLAEAHQVMVACETRILAEFPGADVLIHPDPIGVAEPHGGDFFGETIRES